MSKIPKSLKQSFVATSLVALTALIPATGKLGNIFGGSTAHAQDSAHAATLPPDFNKVQASIPQQREAWQKAGEYAKTHQVVAFSVTGHAKDATAQQIGEFIKNRFEQMGVPSVFFIGHAERLGAGVSFYLRDMQYGPAGVLDIPKEMDTVAAHFLQAWPNYQASLTSAPIAGKN